MISKFFFASLIALASYPTLCRCEEPLMFSTEDNHKIAVDNQILAKVNGKAISVLDVMKKMDMLFYRQFPEYISSAQARYQFYLVTWKRILQDLIDKELIMADAEESKLQVSGGDIRQEMELLFGPNIHSNLDKVGLTFDEAYRMVFSDIVLKRMLYIKAHSKALKAITPQMVQKTYEEYAEANKEPSYWVYTIVSIRDKNPNLGAEAANQAYKLLIEDAIPLDKLKKKMSLLASVSSTTSINVSEEIKNTDAELSPQYKEILATMSPSTYSHAVAQKSRQDGTTVFRIFYLKEILPEQKVPFQEVENKIKDQLLDEASSKETKDYIKKLRKHFDVQENLKIGNEDFKPFNLI